MPRPSSDGRKLNGPARAAIFMLAIGESHAGKLLQMMEDEEIWVLSQQMACLGTISSDVVENLLLDFGEHVSSAGALVGTMESTERLLSKILDSRAREADHGGYPRSPPAEPCGISSATSTRRCWRII